MTVVLRPPVVGLLEELGRPQPCGDVADEVEVADEVHEALTVAGGGGLADVDVDLGGGTIDVDSRARTSSRRAAVVVTSLRNAARSGLLTVLTCAASPLRAAFGSVGVTAWAITRVEQVDSAAVDVLTFAPGAVLGRHPTRLWPLFSLVSGTGWAAGSDGARECLVTGDGVLWEPGEEHQSGTTDGMVAVVVQTPVPPPSRS